MTSGRFVENFGLMHLAESLHKAGYVCATPVIDDGADLVAIRGKRCWSLQLKAATDARFTVEQKYRGVDAMVYVFYARSANPAIYALSYREAEKIMEDRGHTETESWRRGGYAIPIRGLT